jgi:sirohydrochlorin ferrochelatase
MEVSDVRRRLRGAIEDARRRVAERRARADEATRAYERFLTEVAIPSFHMMAQALVGEGHRFKVHTPGQAVRLAPDRASEEYIEVALDTDRDVPAVVARSIRGRGRRMISSERPIGEHKAIAELGEEDVIATLLEELVPFVER